MVDRRPVRNGRQSLQGRHTTTQAPDSGGRVVVPTDVGRADGAGQEPRAPLVPRRETEDFGSAQVRAAIAAREARRHSAAADEPNQTQDYGSVTDFQAAYVSRTTEHSQTTPQPTTAPPSPSPGPIVGAPSAWPEPAGSVEPARDWQDEVSPYRIWWILGVITVVVIVWRVAC